MYPLYRMPFDNAERFLESTMPIQAVSRALKILSLFSSSRPRLGIAEISRLMNLPKPTVHGLVQTLLGAGFLSQDEHTRRYTVGLQVVELGSIFAGNLKINQAGAELVQRMAVSCCQHARIAIWDKDTMLITHNAFPSLESPTYQLIGPRVPAYCSSIGKAVLSALDDAGLTAYLERTPLQRFTPSTITDREALRDCLQEAAMQGYATENGEFMLGLSCVAVPVFDGSLRVTGAISLSGTPDILSGERLAEVVPLLIQTGQEVSRRMGYYPESAPVLEKVVG